LRQSSNIRPLLLSIFACAMVARNMGRSQCLAFLTKLRLAAAAVVARWFTAKWWSAKWRTAKWLAARRFAAHRRSASVETPGDT
jgi:hypothetical protein